MAPEIGFEPMTTRLTVGHSTAELFWKMRYQTSFKARLVTSVLESVERKRTLP